MKWREWLQDYLTFSRKERIGAVVIVLLILIIWILPNVVTSPKSKITPGDTAWFSAARVLSKQRDQTPASQTNDEISNELVYDHSIDERSDKLFYFDPNTLSRAGWEKLGIRLKTINVIQNYLAKGGHFYKREDLKRIYGISEDQYSTLAPYMNIQGKKGQQNPGYAKNDFKKDLASAIRPKNSLVEINAADTTAFIALPGVGGKLASRIINFRDKLGGFYSVNQVGETYGLPDSTFAKIKPLLKLEDPSVKKFNINTATKDDLKSHPYFRWSLANAIVEYRNQHGNFSSVEDLKKIAVITEEIFRKIKPYCTAE